MQGHAVICEELLGAGAQVNVQTDPNCGSCRSLWRVRLRLHHLRHSAGPICLQLPRNGGEHACSNGRIVPRHVAERVLLPYLEHELLTPEALTLAERTARADIAQRRREASDKPKQRSAAIVRLDRQVEELERMLRDGTLLPAIAGAALDRARNERDGLDQADTAADDRRLEKVLKLLPRIADGYRRQVRALMDGGANPAVSHAARSVLLELFGGPVRLLPAETGDHLVAEVAPGRTVLLQAAGGRRVLNGSGGPLCSFPSLPFRHRVK